MLLLANIGLGSSLKNFLYVYAEIILLRQGGTFYLSVHIQEVLESEVLQFKPQNIKIRKRILYWINTRKLDGVPKNVYLIYTRLLVCATFLLFYPKEPCIILKINIYRICCIILSYSKIFYNVSCDM